MPRRAARYFERMKRRADSSSEMSSPLAKKYEAIKQNINREKIREREALLNYYYYYYHDPLSRPQSKRVSLQYKREAFLVACKS